MNIRRVFLVGAVGTLAFPAIANAQSATCTQAYEKAQEERADGHLTAALVQLRICVASGCSEFISEDCKRWLNQAEAELPTVVFSVLRDGKDVTEAEVFCDGDLLTGALDGKALSLDPGFHMFAARIPGAVPLEQKVLIREGQRNRLVEFEFHSSRPVSATPAPALDEPLYTTSLQPSGKSLTYWTYGLSSIGVLGLAGFSLFAVLGKSEKTDLQHSCAPYCEQSQVDSIRTKYVIADTCLGVGIVSLGIATYLYFSSRGQDHGPGDERTEASVEFVPQPTGAGGVLRLSRPF